jgi:hypothetical protein
MARNKDLSIVNACWLTVIPRGCGGFRVPNATELTQDDDIPVISELTADLSLLSRTFPSKVCKVREHIINNIRPTVDAAKSVITGTFLTTSLPDTTGLAIATELVDNVARKCASTIELGKDPFTAAKIAAVSGVLRTMGEIDIKSMSKFFQQLRDWKEYQKSMQLVRTKAGMTLLGRDRIREAQAKDSFKVRKAVTGWVEALNSRRDPYLREGSIMEASMRITFAGLRVKKPRKSMRSLYTFSPTSPDRMVRIVTRL